MSLRERIDTLSRAELAGLVVVIVTCVAGAAFWYLRSLPRPITVAEVPAGAPAAPGASGAEVPFASGVPASSVAVSGASASGQPVPGSVIVDVTGHVRRPGVYEFPAGSRVIDAIERAGGPRDNAVLSALNLAAPLADGQQIVVPGPKDPIAAVPGAPIVSAAPAAPGALVNVNTADATALETLPGIGEVTAAAIIEHRTQNGPFTSVDQLEDVSGIGPSTLEEIRPHVTV
jgi:competence protein ComEA